MLPLSVASDAQDQHGRCWKKANIIGWNERYMLTRPEPTARRPAPVASVDWYFKEHADTDDHERIVRVFFYCFLFAPCVRFACSTQICLPVYALWPCHPHLPN